MLHGPEVSSTSLALRPGSYSSLEARTNVPPSHTLPTIYSTPSTLTCVFRTLSPLGLSPSAPIHPPQAPALGAQGLGRFSLLKSQCLTQCCVPGIWLTIVRSLLTLPLTISTWVRLTLGFRVLSLCFLVCCCFCPLFKPEHFPFDSCVTEQGGPFRLGFSGPAAGLRPDILSSPARGQPSLLACSSLKCLRGKHWLLLLSPIWFHLFPLNLVSCNPVPHYSPLIFYFFSPF